MGYFEAFARWLDQILTTYVAENTARTASALEPAIVLAGTLYVLVWGYCQLVGKVEQPFAEGVRRIVKVAVVMGISLQLWLYNAVIVDSFFHAPGQLAAAIVGEGSAVGIVDRITNSGNTVGEYLLSKGGVLNDNFAYYIAGFLVYVAVCITSVYTMFLLSLSKIALSVLLAIGPLFVPLAMFESTKRIFESWVAQLANYALVALLSVFVSVLMLHVLEASTTQAASEGPAIQIAHAVRVSMSALLTLLVLRQVMPMAAGVASGLSLSTFGVVSSALSWSVSRSTRSARSFAFGFADPRWRGNQSLSGAMGAATRVSLQAGGRFVARRWALR